MLTHRFAETVLIVLTFVLGVTGGVKGWPAPAQVAVWAVGLVAIGVIQFAPSLTAMRPSSTFSGDFEGSMKRVDSNADHLVDGTTVADVEDIRHHPLPKDGRA